MGVAAAVMLSTGAAAAEEMTKLRINRSPVSTFQGLIIAQEKGWFKENGIEVELAIGTSPDAAIAELVAGQSQIAMTGGVTLVAAVATGVPVTAVINGQDDGNVPTHGLLVKADSGLQKITDLKGKKIGLPGIASPQGLYLLEALEKAGMSRDDVELVNLPFPGVTQAIESGAVDAGIPIGLFFDFGKAAGLTELPEYAEQVMVGVPAVFFAANKNWAEENAEVLTKFVAVMQKAHDWANENPDEVRRIDMENTKLPPEYLKTRPYAGLQSAFNTELWSKQVEGLSKHGFISRAPATDEYVWSGAPRK
ncbi:ABC transporter substrate-binding protein [Hoeflea sp.]|uniref:ABC transporter substrate-binding protein n=1 Tax=Hoeflea sp. TaxID=1940281 RepID=UPI0025C28EFD|nr:ABC transporter substrate-binding protein [Hoeflea sp.]